MKKDTVLFGVKIGEHAFSPDDLIQELEERVVKRGGHYAYIRPHLMGDGMSDYIVSWAKYLADNKIYFHFGYNTGQTPKSGKPSLIIDAPTTERIKAVSGEYFLGVAISEASSSYCGKAAGYFRKREGRNCDGAPQKTDAVDMADAYGYYNGIITALIKNFKEIGVPSTLTVDGSVLGKFNLAAGVDIPIIELMCADPEIVIGATRGAINAFHKEFWGTLIAQEWYGGMRHDDMLKRKRLDLACKLAYMYGAKIIAIESGETAINSYGHRYPEDSELCKEYKKILNDTISYAKTDERPAGGPKVKVAFISGKYDAWQGSCQSSIFNQFNREEWGHTDAEHSWRILSAVGTKRKWSDIANYGDYDISATPAYGTYDVVPIEADVDALLKYDRLIFLGWNTMTDENMDKLTEYVRRGGKLLLSGAHLNYSARRDGEYIAPSPEKLSALCGCKFTGKIHKTNLGTKFEYDSLDPEILYPGTKSFVCDPLYSAGYTEYMETELTSGRVAGFASDCFWNDPADFNTVIENKIGDGMVTFIPSKNYPGNAALYPMYNTLVREFLTASARNCDIKVIASDKLRYTVYEGNKMYLLNTDYDLPISVKIIHGDTEKTVMLDSLELKTVQL